MRVINSEQKLSRMHYFVIACLHEKGFPFFRKVGAHPLVNNERLARDWDLLKAQPYETANLYSSVSPEVGLFVDSVNDSRIPICPSDYVHPTAEIAEGLNFLVMKIRQSARAVQFKAWMKKRAELLQSQLLDCTKYVHSLFSRYSKLMILRMDFSYNTGYGDLARLQRDRDTLLRDRRGDTCFEHLVGFIWVIEHGEGCGFHLHALFLFDGQKVCKDGYHAMKLCERWREITAGKGRAHSTNLNKRGLDAIGTCGVGVVDHRQSHKLRNLYTHVIPYLFKGEQSLPYKIGAHDRTLGRGKCAKPPAGSCRGRPRVDV